MVDLLDEDAGAASFNDGDTAATADGNGDGDGRPSDAVARNSINHNATNIVPTRSVDVARCACILVR